ncbi:hypothetical protein JIN84_08100 [Luteolibacter yonseiensis]|uniref:Uncharacterized protein n=1 Tax=Luteolibacter yonseiensis TaxID=1144680 RepID=A0A934V9W0_9BACT|nr:hypothetical protein [Luteolibacter yonseiensis]MBK1815573.1 hypothetical protein [Luteolibacter yonseiensis]
MIPRILPLLIVLPLLSISCKRKEPVPPGTAADTPSAPPSETGFILAKRGHIPPAGTRGKTEGILTIDNATILSHTDGRESKGVYFHGIEARGTFEFLSDTKIRRMLVSRKITGKTVFGDREFPEPVKPVPLEGRPILVEKKDGKWVAALETGTPELEWVPEIEKMADFLNREVDVELYGDNPRKVGDKWDVDPTKIGSFAILDDMTGTYAMEFTGIEDYQGIRCAVLKAEVDLASKSDERQMNMRLRGTVTTHRSLGDLSDLRTVTSGNISIDATPAPDVTAHIEGPVEITQKIIIDRL